MATQKQMSSAEEYRERISSPQELSDYLHVSSPGAWVVFVAVALALVGLLAWSTVGTLETTVDGKVVVEAGEAEVVTLNAESIKAGMLVRVASSEFVIDSTEADEYGRTLGYADVDLPDGRYDAIVVVETVAPIEFLFESR